MFRKLGKPSIEYMCVCVCVRAYIYIYIYIYTHTNTHILHSLTQLFIK